MLHYFDFCYFKGSQNHVDSSYAFYDPLTFIADRFVLPSPIFLSGSIHSDEGQNAAYLSVVEDYRKMFGTQANLKTKT